MNSSSQSVATNTNTPIVVKTKERAGEREREREKERDKEQLREKDLTKTTKTTPTVVKSNGSPPSPPIVKNKAQLKLLPKHIDNVVTTVAAAAAATPCAGTAVSEPVKQKSSTKPENCIKEKLINGTGKAHHNGDGASSLSSSSSSKSNNRRSCDRKVAENEPLSCNEKTKLSNNPNEITDKTKIAVIQLEKSQSQSIETPTPSPPPPPPSTQSSTADKVVASTPVAQIPSSVIENKDEVEGIARTKPAKLPTNTKRTRVQRSSSPKRSIPATTQTPTRQQRNTTFEQAICQVQNPAAKQTTDERLAVKTTEKKQTPTIEKPSIPTAASTTTCPPLQRPLRPSTEKFEYTVINGVRIEVPQRVKFDQKMFTCFVRMNDKPNSKRKANEELADASPEPAAKKRKNAASKKSKVERPEQPTQSIESIKVAEPSTSKSTSTLPPPPSSVTTETTPTQTPTPTVEAVAVEPLAATTIETEAKSVSCNHSETPKSILHKCDRSKAPLDNKKRVSFIGVPISPPSSPEVNTGRTLPPLSNAVESMQSTEISVNDVKIVSDAKKVDENRPKIEKPKKVALRPPTPPLPISTVAAAAVTPKENVTNVAAPPPKVVEPPKKAVDATKKVVEAIKATVVPAKLAVTPIDERLRPKKTAKCVEKSSTKSSKCIEPKAAVSEVESTTIKIVDNLTAPPTPSTTTNTEKNTSKSLATPIVVQQSKIIAPVSIDNNNAISICADEKPEENSLILESSIITAVEESHIVSDTDEGLDRSTPKSVKKKRKPYTKRTKAIKPAASEKEGVPKVLVVTAAATPSKTRGRPPKRKHKRHTQITSDFEEPVEANSVAIVNLEEIKRNNVLDDYCDYPAVVQRSTCVPISLDDKDEDDVRMVMEDDPLAVETDGICASSMSSNQRMPLPMPLLIHRPPEITQISPSKQHQHSPKKMHSPAIQHQSESTRSSPGKTTTSHENIRLKISNGKVTEISPSKSHLLMTTTPISNSPKAGARNRTKRMRKKKQHKDFVVSDATDSDESDDDSPPMINDRKKRQKHLHDTQHAEHENSLVNAAELSVQSCATVRNNSVDQILTLQVPPVSSGAAAYAAAASAATMEDCPSPPPAAMEDSPIASPQYSPVSRQPQSSTFETPVTPPVSMPTTSTTTQQFLQATPIQYDERVFRAYVLVDKIPQVNNDNSIVNTTASLGAATCNVNATTVQSPTTATHVITQPVSISIPMQMQTSPHQTNNDLSNEPITDALENFSQHLNQLQTMHHHSNNGGCDPHSIESFVESCQQFEHCMESIESEANSMNVIQNYTTLNDGLGDGVYELQDGTLCENVESPSMPIVAADNAGGTIIGFESPATVDSTTSGYSSATATSSVYLVDTGTLNQTIEMSNGFSAADFNMQFPFVEINTSDIIDILGKPTNDCGESLNMENISLDSTVPTAQTDDTRHTWLLTDSNGQPILNTINTVATVQAIPTTITTGNFFGVFRTKASLKQIDPLPMQLQINTDGTHQIIHQQQPLASHQHLQQQQQQLHQIINMPGHSHHHNINGTVALPNDISAKMLRTDNPILNAVISSNDESSEMHDASESFSMSVDSMVTSSADTDNVAGGAGNTGNGVNGSTGGSGGVNGGGNIGIGGTTGVNGTHRRPGLNVVFSTPSKRCNNVYLSNENVSIDDFISESNQSLLNPDNFPTTTTTEEPHLDFYTLGI